MHHPASPVDRLRRAGLRVTSPRAAVLEAVDAQPHSDAESLARALSADHPRLSVQSVHNVLRALTDHGLVRRIEPADSAALYESRVGDNHHHVVCRGCGAVADVACVAGHAPCLEPSDAGGFEIDLAEVVFWGMCPECRATGVVSPNTVESPRRSIRD
ncbi:Fur family transcriptional regulator [Homoserinibacter sp. GY 40078]|uniref:Fur family transcriptional regulator n=1 Tax=Homoserinibacter sp. GY 40078 TaxID=2603275 RepID=UPI0021083D66|nr:Fur family transcriptional regulator [Homoserinibacter sp. GY 40078]